MEDVHGRIRGQNFAWRLGSMLSQLLIMVGILSILIIPNLTRLGVLERLLSVMSFCLGDRMRRSSRNSAWPGPLLPRRSVSNRPTGWQIMARK